MICFWFSLYLKGRGHGGRRALLINVNDTFNFIPLTPSKFDYIVLFSSWTFVLEFWNCFNVSKMHVVTGLMTNSRLIRPVGISEAPALPLSWSKMIIILLASIPSPGVFASTPRRSLPAWRFSLLKRQLALWTPRVVVWHCSILFPFLWPDGNASENFRIWIFFI